MLSFVGDQWGVLGQLREAPRSIKSSWYKISKETTDAFLRFVTTTQSKYAGTLSSLDGGRGGGGAGWYDMNADI